MSFGQAIGSAVPRPSRRLLSATHDMAMAGLSFLLSMYLRLGEHVWSFAGYTLIYGLIVFVVIAAVSFRLFGLSAGIWRYASLRDLEAIFRSVTVAVVVFVVLMFLVTRLEALPRSLPIINWFVLVVLLSGPRILYRIFKDRRLAGIIERDAPSRIPVLLVGAGDGAEIFVRAMASQRDASYRVVGILDEKGGRVGREIHGVKVIGTVDEVAETVERLSRNEGDRPQRLILTRMRGRIEGAMVRRLVEQADALGLTLARLPDVTEFRSDLGESAPTLRPIAVEDLLGRAQVPLDLRAIGELIAGRAVLVTGAGGTIGAEVTRQIAGHRPGRLVLLDNSEYNLYSIDMELREAHPGLPCRPVLCDVRDRRHVLRLFASEQPDLVFHAAALKHVPMVEFNPCEGVLTNAVGTRNVADAASASGAAALVLISTDKSVNPSSVMGASKRIAESYCQALDLQASEAPHREATRFITVRFGNVLGSTGSVVPLFERQLRAGGPLTVTHPDIRRYFMTVREAVELVLQASAYGVSHRDQRGKIFVLDMGEPIRIAELARQMIRLVGLQPDRDVRIEFTGLRPGEKLFEELFDAAEPPLPTAAEGVLVAAPRAVDFAILRRMLDELEAVATSGDQARLLTLIGHMVPEFHHPPRRGTPRAREDAATPGG